jgi:DNA helicase II / ATP-dependent DNA helicase PcrA
MASRHRGGTTRSDGSALLKGLTPQQTEAVLHYEGPALVLAAPGSGKTATLTRRVAYLVKVHGVDPGSILAVTFTNKAAKEMKERVHKLVDNYHVASDLTISTFHSLCARLLRESSSRFGVSKRFTICDEADVKSYIKQVLSSISGKKSEAEESNNRVNPDTVRRFISDAKQKLKTPEVLAQEGADPEMTLAYQKYATLMDKANSLDFDDLLFKVVRQLGSDASLRQDLAEIYDFVLVDEYQDTNHAQFNLSRYLSDRTKNLWVCGDPDQSIYHFRGADLSNILLFEKHYAGAKTYRLESNFRSKPAITAVANAIIKNNTDRPEKEIRPTKQAAEHDEVRCLSCVVDQHEAEVVGQEIKRALISGASPNDFAILYRRKVQSRLFEEFFVRNNIPHKVVGSFGFYNRTVVKDVLSYLRLCQNSRDDASFTRIYNKPLRRLGDVAFGKLCDSAEADSSSLYKALRRRRYASAASSEATAGFEQLRRTLYQLRKLSTDSVGTLMEAVADRSGYRRWLVEQTKTKSPSAVAKALSQIEHLNELIVAGQQFDADHGGGLTGFLEWVTLLQQDDQEDAEAKKRVLLMTCHASKGLEFPRVYVVGCGDSNFPLIRTTDDFGRVLSRSEIARAVEEERRLFFVAATRAEERLTFTWAVKGRTLDNGHQLPDNRVSRFIEEAGDLIKHSVLDGGGAQMGQRPRWPSQRQGNQHARYRAW